MKHYTDATRTHRVGQIQTTFTNKHLTAWGGACSIVATYLERIGLREWVSAHVPVEENSPNAKGIYKKALAIPAIYGLGGRCPTLRLGVEERGLRAKIRHSLHRINTFDLRLVN